MSVILNAISNIHTDSGCDIKVSIHNGEVRFYNVSTRGKEKFIFSFLNEDWDKLKNAISNEVIKEKVERVSVDGIINSINNNSL